MPDRPRAHIRTVQASSALTSLAQGARRNRLSLVYAILTDILQMTKGTADAYCEAADGDRTGGLGRQDSNLRIRNLCPAGFTERADRARACWESGARSVATFALHDRVGPIGTISGRGGSSPPAPASRSGLHRLTYCR